MSLLKRSKYPAYSAMTNPLNLLYGQTSMFSPAGERVDEVTALGVASVLSCVSLIADSVASMHWRAFEDGREVPLPPVLQDPDPQESTAYELKHTTVATTALHGNSYTYITRSKSTQILTPGIVIPQGTPIALTPLHPYQMNVLSTKNYTGRMYLHLGTEIPREDLLVIRWFTPPQSLVGISPLAQQRTILGLAMAMDRYLAQWYGEGATPSGVLETERSLTSEQAKVLRESWEGSQRKHRRPAVLSEGLKWRPVQTSAVDMEFNASRDAVLSEVARIFRVPGFMLGIKGDTGTYQNVEQASLNFLVYTLQPWLARIETAFSSLFPGVDVRFDPSSLLRLDALTKARVQLTQIQSGTRTPNEARAVDGLPAYDGGDDFVKVLPGAPIDATATIGVDTDPLTPPVAS
jgi:HK97 family phage portal protein